MELKKYDEVGVWVNAGEEKPPMNDTRVCMKDGYGKFIGLCYKHNTAIWNTESEAWIYDIDFKKYEWLKPIKDVYVLTEDDLQDLITTIFKNIKEGTIAQQLKNFLNQ